MANNRDDFSSATKELLANRVGRKCSNPMCRKLTCGANENPEKITNIGVAAHICAAAKGGPRYDESMTPQERKSFENGIWLCQSCSKLIDTDTTRYTKEILQNWKRIAEEMSIMEVETSSPAQNFNEDKELVQFFVECFDRPAFKDDIYQEGRMEDFDRAIEDAIIALNTGVLRTRDGVVLKQAQGKSAIQNPIWREKFEVISDMLVSLRRRLKIAEAEKAYSKHGTGEEVFYCFSDRELGDWFNLTRDEILKVLSSVCKEAGLHELKFPCRRYRW
ncbi:MAG: HNH endonuclease [Lachnospiraceae bacterium]|nr:HNH endonuclease [Lachnospiraceae bacterium]